MLKSLQLYTKEIHKDSWHHHILKFESIKNAYDSMRQDEGLDPEDFVDSDGEVEVSLGDLNKIIMYLNKWCRESNIKDFDFIYGANRDEEDDDSWIQEDRFVITGRFRRSRDLMKFKLSW